MAFDAGNLDLVRPRIPLRRHRAGAGKPRGLGRVARSDRPRPCDLQRLLPLTTRSFNEVVGKQRHRGTATRERASSTASTPSRPAALVDLVETTIAFSDDAAAQAQIWPATRPPPNRRTVRETGIILGDPYEARGFVAAVRKKVSRTTLPGVYRMVNSGAVVLVGFGKHAWPRDRPAEADRAAH